MLIRLSTSCFLLAIASGTRSWLERAARNNFMRGALDALRVAGKIGQEYINPRDRRTAPWADQQWNMKKMETEAAHILLGVRQDIQAKYHHGRYALKG